MSRVEMNSRNVDTKTSRAGSRCRGTYTENTRKPKGSPGRGGTCTPWTRAMAWRRRHAGPSGFRGDTATPGAANKATPQLSP